MLRDGWNFHGDIAIPLEHNANSFYGGTFRPMNKIYDADAIETGNFVEVMILLLRESTHFSNEYDAIDEFVRECAPYLGKSGNSIDREIAAGLYAKFLELYE